MPEHSIPTEQAIRALDGPALTTLARDLGLAPQGVVNELPAGWCWSDGALYLRTDDGYLEWTPHKRIDQADAVFRSLRARGWSTSVVWFADDRRHGDAWACNRCAVSVRWVRPEEEALALLRCACLAVASDVALDVLATTDVAL